MASPVVAGDTTSVKKEIRSEKSDGMVDPKEVICFQSSDGVVYQLDTAMAIAAGPGSPAIQRLIKDSSTGSILVLDFRHEVLEKVVDYCHKHARLTDGEELTDWDASFVEVGHAMLYDLIQAAHYLNMQGLLLITCKAVADMIKDKTPQEVRETLSIKCDFTPEEEMGREMRVETFQWTRKVTRISADGAVAKEDIHKRNIGCHTDAAS